MSVSSFYDFSFGRYHFQNISIHNSCSTAVRSNTSSSVVGPRKFSEFI